VYIILVYDIGEKRVGKMLKICRKYLNWVQNSVFEGELTPGKFEALKNELQGKMKKEEDSILIYMMRTEKMFKKIIIGVEKNDPNENFI
jgi:CRISPR-associated protein Cas2